MIYWIIHCPRHHNVAADYDAVRMVFQCLWFDECGYEMTLEEFRRQRGESEAG